MPRPQRKRTIYQLPVCRKFTAEGAEEHVRITLDELEAIRLLDCEGLDQEECAERLHVARSTAQNIIRSARSKIAKALVCGKTIEIGGGCVEFSDDREFGCCRDHFLTVESIGGFPDIVNNREEVIQVRIAVSYDKETGEIFQHFGRTEFFKVYDIENGTVRDSQVVNTNGMGHGALASILLGLHADALICGGIGGGAQMALSEAGIKLFGGCIGNADQAVSDFLAGKLAYQEDVRCDHHGTACGHEAGACCNGDR